MSRVALIKIICLFTLVASASSVMACSSTTRITSRPSQAEVVLNGEKRLGETPMEVRDMGWVWRTRQLQFNKDGYHTTFVDLESEFRGSSVATCLCTVGLLLPVLFVGEFPAELSVQLDPIERAEIVDFSEARGIEFP
ncbi:MAG: PEGA domain-containing protein [Bradymonadaceae bacterium]